jgi:hypothetical protein
MREAACPVIGRWMPVAMRHMREQVEQTEYAQYVHIPQRETAKVEVDDNRRTGRSEAFHCSSFSAQMSSSYVSLCNHSSECVCWHAAHAPQCRNVRLLASLP